MARIFITGSADGLGQLAAELLVDLGHKVVLHARNDERAKYALRKVRDAEGVLIADFSNIEETKQLAEQINRLGAFDAIIHNAGVYQASGALITSVNTLAPYILTCLIQKTKRLIYLSSSSHLSGHPNLENLKNDHSRITYSDSKLHNLILSMAVARKWPNVFSNALDPGWVPTKMGGPGAPDNLEKGFQTQVWLAVSNDDNAKVSGQYFFHKKVSRYRNEADDVALQEKFLSICELLTKVKFPKNQD